MPKRRKWYERSKTLILGLAVMVIAMKILGLIDDMMMDGVLALIFISGLTTAQHADELQDQIDHLEHRVKRVEQKYYAEDITRYLQD